MSQSIYQNNGFHVSLNIFMITSILKFETFAMAKKRKGQTDMVRVEGRTLTYNDLHL